MRPRMMSVLVLGWAAVLTGCAGPNWHFHAVRDVRVNLPEFREARDPVRAGMPPEPVDLVVGGGQTALIAYYIDQNASQYDVDPNRAMVIVLDDLAAKGPIEVTPENGRLILHTEWAPPRRPYLGLEGTVRIVKVKNDEVRADVDLRSVIRRTGDRVYVLRGLYDFKFAGGGEMALNRGAVRLIQ